MTHSISLVDASITNALSNTTNSTYFTIRLPEITTTTSSANNPVLTIYLRAGVKNGRAVITTASANNFTLVTFDPTGTFVGDVCTSSLMATPSLVPATATAIQLT